MVHENTPHLIANEKWQLLEAKPEDLEVLHRIIGPEPLSYLTQESIKMYAHQRHHEFYKDVHEFYFEIHGRVVDLIHSSKYPDRLEICYAFVEDFLTDSEETYTRSGTLDNLDESMLFIGFMRRWLATFKKDAPLVMRGTDEKRRGLVRLLVASAGLTNVKKV